MLACSLFAGQCIVTLNARCKVEISFTLSKQPCGVEFQLKNLKGPKKIVEAKLCSIEVCSSSAVLYACSFKMF